MEKLKELYYYWENNKEEFGDLLLWLNADDKELNISLLIPDDVSDSHYVTIGVVNDDLSIDVGNVTIVDATGELLTSDTSMMFEYIITQILTATIQKIKELSYVTDYIYNRM